MQSLMGETTAVAHGGDPQDRAASPRPRCIAFAFCLLPFALPVALYTNFFPIPRSAVPCSLKNELCDRGFVYRHFLILSR
ncbi:hypothetical protein [Moorena producens]|uniref:hypothetical protein n=1 Tax=Moorena producens TaxID=1155739 RepID=UPI001314734F|nr:hypothetical protein [Moorena producens]